MSEAKAILDTYGIDVVREALRLHDTSALYYEAHITIEPVPEDRRNVAELIAMIHDFKLAKLLMVKERSATPERSDKDTFMTGHSTSLADLTERMRKLVFRLRDEGFDVWRYKIEDTLIDSRFPKGDIYGVVTKQRGDAVTD